MDPLTYYAEQSTITAPGKYEYLFTDLPDTVDELCKIIRGLYIHYRSGESLGHQIPDDRLGEVDIRYVEKMLARIVALDDRPLQEKRPLEKRLVGCCRDASALFCAMARFKGIPVRARVGFAEYIGDFGDTFCVDHEIIEVWNDEKARWQLVDTEQNARLIKENNIDFDVHDVPRDQFVTGGLAWQKCRSGKADPNRFGVHPDLDFKGMWFIRSKLMQDLAALNRMETLLWDAWGLMNKEPNEEEQMLLDEAAQLSLVRSNKMFDRTLAIYNDNVGLKVPPTFTSYSPVSEPKEINLYTV